MASSAAYSSTVSTTPSSTFLHAEFQAGVTACLRSWSALRTAVESGWGGGPLQSETKAEELRTNILHVLDGRKPPLQPSQSSSNNDGNTSTFLSSSTLAISNYDSYDLADHLAIYLEEEFSVTLEDESERQVAETIFRLYETCWNGDTTMANRLMMQAETAAAATAAALLGQSAGSRPQIQTVVGAGGELDGSDDDSDDEIMVDDENMMDNDEGIDGGGMVTAASAQVAQAAQPTLTATSQQLSAQDYASQPVFGSGGKRKVSVPTGPIRQLGQIIMEEPVVEMDDDGFAPVKPKGRRKK